MKKKIILSAVLLFVVCLSTIADSNEEERLASPGLKLVALSKTSSGDAGSPTTMFIGESELVLQAVQGSNKVTITFDANTNVITLIDHQKKQYSIFREKELQEISEQLNSMKAIAKAFFENMPEEQKEKLAPLVNGKPKGISYKTGVNGVKINNWKTTEYKATYEQGKRLFDTNIVDFSVLGIKQNDIAAVTKLATLLDKYLAGIEGMIPGASVFSNLSGKDNPMFSKGIPVKTVSYNSKGSASAELIVSKAEKVNFSLSEFKAPANYKQISFQLQNPMGR